MSITDTQVQEVTSSPGIRLHSGSSWSRAGWSGLPQARNTPGTKTTRCRNSYCLLPFLCISWDLVTPKPAMASPPSCEDEPYGSERLLVASPYLVPFVLSTSSCTASWQGLCVTKTPCSDQTQGNGQCKANVSSQRFFL
jgi:hypothetical protein